jgi:ISXO2-like transposase domain/Transposase zinc-ribbon domain
MKPGKDPLTLPALQKRFSDPATCLAFLEKARWPDGPICPGCGVVNTAESVHAMFKRAIIGVWHHITGKHMHRYVGEIEFRWNRRGPFESRLAILFGTKSGPLPLKALFA